MVSPAVLLQRLLRLWLLWLLVWRVLLARLALLGGLQLCTRCGRSSCRRRQFGEAVRALAGGLLLLRCWLWL
jgi:hypothetical protein